ncbi:hypothetical protein J7E37_19575 [Bacillus sp. ISL-39]|nr:hypothetical protein [Bacillus sp. ISL-39]
MQGSSNKVIGDNLILLAEFTILLAIISFYWRFYNFIGENPVLLANWKFPLIFTSSHNHQKMHTSRMNGVHFPFISSRRLRPLGQDLHDTRHIQVPYLEYSRRYWIRLRLEFH